MLRMAIVAGQLPSNAASIAELPPTPDEASGSPFRSSRWLVSEQAPSRARVIPSQMHRLLSIPGVGPFGLKAGSESRSRARGPAVA